MAQSKWTEKIIQAAIWRRYGAKLPTMLPNYTPENWFEADVWSVTAAGFAVEYEIKTSRADFKNDFSKGNEYGRFNRGGYGHKHQRLSLGDTSGPNRFFYVAPVGIIAPEMLPEYAGLLEVAGAPSLSGLMEIKKAPRLHRSTHELNHRRISISIYHRYWQLKERTAMSGDLSEKHLSEIESLIDKSSQKDLAALVRAQAITIKTLKQQNDQLRGSTN